jgi:thymidylate synthase
MKNNVDKKYFKLLEHLLKKGVPKKDRTGTGTISVFDYSMRFDMSEGFPLLTSKKMFTKGVIHELIWFLRGDTNIKYLVDNDCHIWNGDAYKNYLVKTKNQIKDPNDLNWNLSTPKDPEITQLTQEEFINRIKTDDEFVNKWGELGPVYGKQWRSWKGLNSNTDQIANLINDLKTNPDSRRLMVNAWNVGELDQMVLPPCHYGFQVYTRELSAGERWDLLKFAAGEEWYNSYVEDLVTFGGGLSEEMELFQIPERAISLMWNQRSVDTFLGLPFNIASYGLLLEIIANEVNMVPEELIGNLGDVHLYSNHIDQAKEQISRESYELPNLTCLDEYWYLNDMQLTFSEKINKFRPDFFKIEDYKSHETIKAPLSN